jgi:hypothetical protein
MKILKYSLVSLVALVCLAFTASSALASSAGLQGGSSRAPGWRLRSETFPTHLQPGGTGFIEIGLANIGAVTSSGRITVTDALPAGVRLVGLASLSGGGGGPVGWSCTGVSVVTCTTEATIGAGGETSSLKGELVFEVAVEAGGEGVEENEVNVVTVGGGGASEPSRLSAPVVLSATPAGFGVADVQAWASNPDGGIDTLAGSHPYELGVSLDLNSLAGPNVVHAHGEVSPVAAGSEVRDVTVNLPPGVVADPQAVPRCPHVLFERESECPAATQVGVDTVMTRGGRIDFPVFNLVPPPGSPAQFGFQLHGINTYLDSNVRSGGDSGITTRVQDIVQRNIVSNQTVIWGVPSDPSHDSERCVYAYNPATHFKQETCGISGAGGSEQPFLTMPSQCSAPLNFTAETDAWLEPSWTGLARYTYSNSNDEPVLLHGCADLTLNPSIDIAPDTTVTDTPAGLGVDIKVPQEGLLEDEALAPANLKNTKVVLPAGVAINPGQAVGLGACQQGPAEPSPHGVPLYPGRDNLPLPGPNAAAEGETEKFDGPADCPSSAQVGTDEIEVPLLAKPVKGSIYVMQSDPPDLELLMTAEGEGVYLKLLGHVELNEATGQLTTTFDETPSFPFTQFKLNFSGGARAALVTPSQCGTYNTFTDFTPWSTPFSTDVFPPSSFTIDQGVGGAGVSGQPIAVRTEADRRCHERPGRCLHELLLLLTRGDGQQRIGKLQFKAPEGLTGFLSKVPLCTTRPSRSGRMPRGVEDRAYRRGVWPRTVSAGRAGTGPGTRPDLPHRILRRRALRPGDRRPAARRPVHPGNPESHGRRSKSTRPPPR